MSEKNKHPYRIIAVKRAGSRDGVPGVAQHLSMSVPSAAVGGFTQELRVLPPGGIHKSRCAASNYLTNKPSVRALLSRNNRRRSGGAALKRSFPLVFFFFCFFLCFVFFVLRQLVKLRSCVEAAHPRGGAELTPTEQDDQETPARRKCGDADVR